MPFAMAFGTTLAWVNLIEVNDSLGGAELRA